MHEMIVKNVDRYVWYGDQRKLKVITMDGHIYRFYRVIEFEGKSYDTVYFRELEKSSSCSV